MAETNNLEIIKENFEKITNLLNTIRTQGTLSTNGLDKILTSINTKLDLISNDENEELIKTFLAELKRNMEEKYGFITAKFADLEHSYNSLSKDKDGVLKNEDVKEFFDIIATNLNVFSKEVVSQKDLLTEITLRIEALRADDTDKKDILRNIAVLKTDIEHFNNAFESIVVNLNNNFKNIISGIEHLKDTNDLEQYGKDIENLYLTSNAILSAIQIIDQKNESLDQKLGQVITSTDFKNASDQIIAQNKELNYLVSGLANRSEVMDLLQKIDTSIGIISGLRALINEASEKNHEELLLSLDKLEDTVKKILSEEDFDKFRLELSRLVSDVTQGTNLMRGDLLETNAEIRNLISLLNSMDIKTNFNILNETLNKKEDNIVSTIDNMSNKILQSAEFNTIRAVSKTDEIYSNLVERLNESSQSISKNYEEIRNNVKTDLDSLHDFVEGMSGSLNEKTQNVVSSILEQTNTLEQKLSELDFNVNKSSKLNVDTIEAQLYELKNTLKSSEDEISSELYLRLDKVINTVENLSGTILSAVGESDTSNRKVLEQNHLETKGILDQNAEEIKRLSESTHNIGTALSFVEESIKQKIEEDLGTARDIVEKTSYDTSNALNSFSDSFDLLKHDISDLRQDVHVTANSVRDIVTNLSDSIGTDYEELCRANQDFIEKSTNDIQSALLKNEDELKLISQSASNLQDELFNTKSTIDSKLSDEFDQIKNILAVNDNNAVSARETLSKDLESIESNFENIYQNIMLTNSEISEKINSLPEEISNFNKEVQEQNTEILNRNDENIQKLLEDVQKNLSMISLIDSSLKQKFDEEINSTKELLKELKETSSVEFNNTIQGISIKLSELRELSSSTNEDSSNLMLRLKDALVEYIENVKEISVDTNEKITSSAIEISDIKSELAGVYDEIKLINAKNNDEILQNSILSNFENIFEKFNDITTLIGPSDRNRADFESIQNSLANVISILEEQTQKIDNPEVKDSLSNIYEQIESLKQQLELTETDIKEVINNQNSLMSSEFTLVKDIIREISTVNLPENFETLKQELTLANNDLKNYLFETSDNAVKNIGFDLNTRFDLIKTKIEELGTDIDDKRVLALNDIKTLLGNITSSLTDIISYVSVEPQTLPDNISSRLTKFEQSLANITLSNSEGLKFAVDDTVSFIDEKLIQYAENNKTQLVALKSEFDNNVSIIRNDIKNYSTIANKVLGKLNYLDEKIVENTSEIKENLLPILNSENEIKDLVEKTLSETTNKIQEKTKEIEKLLLSNELKQAVDLKNQLTTILTELANVQEEIKTQLDEKSIELQKSLNELFENSNNNKETIVSSIDSQFEKNREEFGILSEKLVNLTSKISENTETKFNVIQNNITNLHEKMSEINLSLSEGAKNYYENIKQKFITLEEKFKGMDTLIDEDMTKQLALIREEFMQFSNRLYEFSEKTTNDELGRFEKIQEEFKKLSSVLDELGTGLFRENSAGISTLKSDFASILEANLDLAKTDLSIKATANCSDLSEKISKAKNEAIDAILNEFNEKTRNNVELISTKISDTIAQGVQKVAEEAEEISQSQLAEISNVVSQISNNVSREIVDEVTNKANLNVTFLSEKIEQTLKDGVTSLTTEIFENSSSNTVALQEFVEGKIRLQSQDIIDILNEKIQLNTSKISEKVEYVLNNHSDIIVNEILKTQDIQSDTTDKIKDFLKENFSLLIGEISSNLVENNSLLNDKVGSIVKSEINIILDFISEKSNQDTTAVKERIDDAIKYSVSEIITTLEENSQNNVAKISDLITSRIESSTGDLKTSIEEIASSIENNVGEIQSSVNTISNSVDIIAGDVQATTDKINSSIEIASEDIKNALSMEKEEIVKTFISNAKSNLSELKLEFENLTQKVNPDEFISRLSNDLCQKLDENSEELKSFIDLKLKGDVDLSLEIDNLKSDVVDMFNEYGKSFKSTISELTKKIENTKENEETDDSISEKLEELPSKIDKVVDDLLLNYQTKISDILSNSVQNLDNQNLQELLNANNSHLITYFNSMKDSLSEDIFSKFEEFNINFQRQIKIMQKIDELSELSGETSGNINPELLNKIDFVLEKTESEFEKIQNNLGNKITEEKDNLYNSIAKKLSDFDEKLSELKANLNNDSTLDIDVIEKAFNTNISPLLSGLNAKLEDINSDIKVQTDRINDLDYLPRINEIEDLFNMNVGSLITEFEKKVNKYDDMDDVKELVSEIKSDITSQILGLFDKISFVAEQEEIIDFVQDRSNELKSLVKKLDNSLDARFEDGYKGYAEELRELVKDFKENSDFKATLEEIKNQINTLRTSDEENEYTYSLQDIETDIAKLRLTLNQIDKATNYDNEFGEITNSINELATTVDYIKTELPHNEVFEIKNEIERISEDLTSISTRTNKLILASDESNNTLRDNLSDFRLVIRDLDERTRDLANTANMERMNARVEKVASMVNSCINSDKVFSKAFEYLAEWIDGAGENLNYISDSMDRFEKMENISENIAENVRYISEKVDNVDNFAEIKSVIESLKTKDEDKNSMFEVLEQKFEAQQTRIEVLEDKLDKLLNILEMNDTTQMTKKISSIDKQLSKLNKSIERLTSYVDEE